MLRLAIRILAGAAILAFLIYVADWAFWEARVARGSGMGSVEVFPVTTVAIKGNKEAIYPDGSTTVECSRSLFPQAGGGSCWWLRRHRQVVVRH